jgi:hypothetical protein
MGAVALLARARASKVVSGLPLDTPSSAEAAITVEMRIVIK